LGKLFVNSDHLMLIVYSLLSISGGATPGRVEDPPPCRGSSPGVRTDDFD